MRIITLKLQSQISKKSTKIPDIQNLPFLPLVSSNVRDAWYLKKTDVSDVKPLSGGRSASFLSKNPFHARSSPRTDSRLLERSRGVVYRVCKHHRRCFDAYYYARDASRCDAERLQRQERRERNTNRAPLSPPLKGPGGIYAN